MADARVLEVIDGEEDFVGRVIETVKRFEVGGHVVVDVLDRLEEATKGYSRVRSAGLQLPLPEGDRQGREQARPTSPRMPSRTMNNISSPPFIRETDEFPMKIRLILGSESRIS